MSAVMKIPNHVLDVLLNSRLEGPKLFLPDVKLDRPDYEAVNKVLAALGGKWNRGAKAHVFPECPADALDAVLQTGAVTNRKQAFQFFETPDALADQLVSLADISLGMSILEPSAGRGAIVRAILRQYSSGVLITLVELDPKNHAALGAAFPVTEVPVMECICLDFLATRHYPRFDRVVMNPPFTRQQDIDHVRHAAEWLKPGGVLVSVMSASVTFRTDRKTAEFKGWLDEHSGTITSLPEGSFRSSGTDANTVIVKLRKGGGA